MSMSFATIASIIAIGLPTYTSFHSHVTQLTALRNSKVINGVQYRNGDGGTSLFSSPNPAPAAVLGGTILITGLRGFEEDNFLMNLINEQPIWDNIITTPTEETTTQASMLKSQFLTRTNKYSGLLDKLEILPFTNWEETDKLSAFMTESKVGTWIAFNVTQASIPQLAKDAAASGVKRLIATIELSLERINDTIIPEFETASASFTAAGGAFTGIRHGLVIAGTEDNAYEIVNTTIPCLEDTVERGVLDRVVAEMLSINATYNTYCGVCSSSPFASAYLQILRGSGLTRGQEVKKLFDGGLQRVARLTVQTYDRKRDEQIELKAKAARKVEKDRLEKLALSRAPTPERPEGYGEAQGVDFDEEDEDEGPTDEEKIETRSQEILLNVWREYDSRMYAKSTTKNDFFMSNTEKAMELARVEIEGEKQTAAEEEKEKEANKRMMDKIDDINRRQYSKLLSLERKEMQNQKMISDTWVKYVYLLLEMTVTDCVKAGKLFHNLDEYQQTLLLREKANELRALVGLSGYEVIYDPLDATVIVDTVMAPNSPLKGLPDSMVEPVRILSTNSSDEIGALLETKHGKLLTNVAALRGASQIVELAVETLKKELPAMPPTVAEIRAFESKAKSEMISKMKLDGIRNRGKPAEPTDVSDTVGRM